MARQRIDIEEMERLKETLPIGKCITMEATEDGEPVGMQVCRAGEDDFRFHSKDGAFKGSLKMTDFKE